MKISTYLALIELRKSAINSDYGVHGDTKRVILTTLKASLGLVLCLDKYVFSVNQLSAIQFQYIRITYVFNDID